MRVVVLASGSSGNAVVVEAGVRLLVDAGLGPRALERALVASGLDPSRRFDGIVATHEHGDHFGGAEKLSRMLGCPVWLHEGIVAARLRRRADVRGFAPGEPFVVGDLSISACEVPHDAPQVALRVESAEWSFAYATDVGHVTPALEELLGASDAGIVEANHAVDLLRAGPYPPHLKQRIASGRGHLNNDEVARLAQTLAGSRLASILLGHVSRANNTPERALATVRAKAGAIAVDLVEQGEIRELARPLPTGRRHRSGPLGQLSLPFEPNRRAGHSGAV